MNALQGSKGLLAKLNRNEKILLGVILFVTLLGYHHLVVSPWKNRGADLARQLVETRAKVDLDRRTYDELAGRVAMSGKRLQSQELVDRFDRSNDRFSKIITELTTQSQAAPLVLKRFATGKPSSSPEYTKMPVDLDIEASFPEIGHFLEKLGDIPLLAEVESLEIYRQENDLKKCSARIKLLSYVVKR